MPGFLTTFRRNSRASVIGVIIAAIVAAGVLVRRQPHLRGSGPSEASPTSDAVQTRRVPVRVGSGQRPTPVDNWDQIAAAGHRKGPAGTPVTVVEFSDFQCPYCRFFETRVMPAILRQFDGEVSWTFRHSPLDIRPHAYHAARASECAAEQGRFWELHDTLFAQQAAIGHKPFTEFARESGVQDLPRFTACVADTLPVAAIEADLAAVRTLGATGTPTVIVNGIRYPGTPDSAAMVRAVLDALGRR